MCTNRNIISGIWIAPVSDHLAVYITLPHLITKKLVSDTFEKRRIYSAANIENFRNKLNEVNWSRVLDAQTTNDKYTYFVDIIDCLINSCFPLTTIKINPIRDSKPWITPTILNSVKKKNTMYKQYLITKSPTLLDSYKKDKNKLTSILRQAEKNYFASKLLEAKDNMSKTWKVINKITKKTSSKSSVEQLADGGSLIKDPVEIAKKFNKFFINIGSELREKIPTSSITPNHFLKGHYSDSMFLLPTTTEEVTDIIHNLKNSTSVGHDNISTKLIKSCAATLAPVLAHINNQSLTEGLFPDAMKIAKVVPIFKNGDANNVSNYRPISILPAFSKLTEKLMYSRLDKYLTNNIILHQNQFGFRAKLSTSMALLELMDKLSGAMDEKLYTVGVFIDLAKAFDTVDHHILLGKLEHYGIRGTALNWFRSYLTDRQQFVSVSKHESPFARISCGVPQGSILGPILFLLYINDLNCVSNLLRIIMFADDTNFFITGSSLQKVEDQLNDELIIISEWFKTNLLSLNLTKTSYMIFGTRKYNDINLRMQNTPLTRQYETKFLGIILSANLKWHKHIDVVLNKTSKSIGIISKVRHLLPPYLTRMLYMTLVEPYLNYCNLIWASGKKTELLERVLKMQKKFCRLITFSHFSAHSAPLFSQLNILNIYNIYKYNLATYMFKIRNSLLPALGHHQFVVNSATHEYGTRKKDDLKLPYCRTNLRQNTICFQGPKLWNNIPADIKQTKSLNIFKRSVKQLIMNLTS